MKLRADDRGRDQVTASNKRRTALMAAAITLVALISCAAALATTSEAKTHPRLSEHRILKIALRYAKSQGDKHPTLIQHSAGTRRADNKVDGGDVVPGSAWCYLIAERGHFVDKYASVPAGAKAPKGKVITLVVNARTGRALDSGIGNKYPQLKKLGKVTTDLRVSSGGILNTG